MKKIAVAVTSQVALVTSIAYLEKKYGSLDNLNVIILISHDYITDHEAEIITDIAKKYFLINDVIDLREALSEYIKHRKKIKNNLFKYKNIKLIKQDLNRILKHTFKDLTNIDLLIIRKPSRFPELFVIKYVAPISISRIEDGANAIISPYIPVYFSYKFYFKKIVDIFSFFFYRFAGCGDEMTFIYKPCNLPQAHSIQDGSIDSYLLLENFKKIKKKVDAEKLKGIKLLFLGTYDISFFENSIEAIKKDCLALDILKTKYLLENGDILYKPHPKTFINMKFEDYFSAMNVRITSETESLMMAECLSIYMIDLKWIVSGAGSYSLFVISNMFKEVEPVMIRYKDNSHTKKQYDAAINKYIKENKVQSIIV